MKFKRGTHWFVLVWMILGSIVQGQDYSGLKEGETAPGFHVITLSGEELDSSQLKGDIAVLNFWFIQCPPCRAEIPKLNRLVKEYEGKPVHFIAFAPDDEASLEEFLTSVPFDYKIVANATPIAQKFGVTGAPTHVILDSEGVIAKIYLGEVASPMADLGSMIDRLLE